MSFVSARQVLTSIGSLAAIAVLAAGCGGGGGGGGTVVTAKKGAFAFDPVNLTVEKGKPVTVTLKNPDTQIHDWLVRGITPEIKVEALPGKEASVTFTPANAGEFVVYCGQPGHEQAGMIGKLIVK